MITTNNPYNRKVGLNLANTFFINLDTEHANYLDLLFRDNEREAIGRRILIMIYLLEGFSMTEISEKLSCGKVTVNRASSMLKNFNKDKQVLLEYLIDIYQKQFPQTEPFVGGSRTISGSKSLLGLGKNKPKRKFIPL